MKATRLRRDEYRRALDYYESTVWRVAKRRRLTGAEYDVALLAYDRLCGARNNWLDSMSSIERANELANTRQIEDLAPCRLERDDTVSAEQLASIAATRLRTRKPDSLGSAIAEAHKILESARHYLASLPKPKEQLEANVDAHLQNKVTFREILEIIGEPDRIPLLPPVQAKRNDGKLTVSALEKALERHGKSASTEVRNEIRQALKNKEISCHLLESVRWTRFLKHSKS